MVGVGAAPEVFDEKRDEFTWAREQLAGLLSPAEMAGRVVGEAAEFPFDLGAHASAVICGHAIYVTLAWAVLAMAAAVAAAVPLARTVLAARRAP